MLVFKQLQGSLIDIYAMLRDYEEELVKTTIGGSVYVLRIKKACKLRR